MKSWVRPGVVAAVLVAAFWSIAGDAQSPPSQGDAAPAQAQAAAEATGKPDAARGHALTYTCLGCHGVAGYRNAYPNYSVPKLEGQHADYMVSALKAYQVGERAHPTMHSQSESLSDQDMIDIAAFFAGTPVASSGKTPPDVPQAAGVCVSCHGPDGVGVTSIYPTLAGQHADYLARALHDYKYGGRKNPIMGTFATQLSDAQIEELAHYFSKQQPSLKTLERPYTRLGMDK